MSCLISTIVSRQKYFTGAWSSPERLVGDGLKLDCIIGWWWKFKFVKILWILNCFKQFRFSVSHLTASRHYTIIHSLILKILLNSSHNYGHIKYLLCIWPLSCINLEQTFDYVPHVNAIACWYLWILPFQDTFKESIHIICSERRNKSTHFIKNATKRPDIRFAIVGLVLPNLRACIIRSPSLGIK